MAFLLVYYSRIGKKKKDGLEDFSHDNGDHFSC